MHGLAVGFPPRYRLQPISETSEKQFLNFVLGEYVDHRVEELGVEKLPDLLHLKYGGMKEGFSVKRKLISLSREGYPTLIHTLLQSSV